MRALLVLAILVPISATAGPRDVVGGPSNELYIKRRPPRGVVLSPELRALLEKTEYRADAKRLEAITLLRGLLASNPTGDVKADGLFKLAELVWEEARRTYLIQMEDYARKLLAYQDGSGPPPKEPHIDLGPAEKLYIELHDSFPAFRRTDLVIYLIGFAANEAGRDDDAMARFQEVVKRFPDSPVAGDAWMMIGEHHYRAAAWQAALDAFRKVRPDAATYDLALFKRAWCEWKLGNTALATADFKEVINETIRRERFTKSKRGVSLRDEAIEYLVVVFTEDRAVPAKEVFSFLGSMDPTYSRDILVRVAESYAAQAEWERSAESFRFLIGLDSKSIRAADHQRRIVENSLTSLDESRAQDEIRQLLEAYGPRSAWARSQTDRDALARSLATTEQLVRQTAINLHGEAQRSEKALGRIVGEACIAKPELPAELTARYARAAEAYDRYLATFDSPELRYYRADILCFKLGRPEEAGDAYLALGKTAPIGKYHRDALLNAIDAYERARPAGTTGRHQLYPVDQKLAQAVDLYAKLFPDARLPGVLFKHAQMYFDYGEYDEAVKRFAAILRKYPDDANAGPAADKIMSALAAGKKYEELYQWTRGLARTKWFTSNDQRKRIAAIMAGALDKTAQQYADAHQYDRAATLYLELRKQARDPAVAAQALMNAGVMYEQAKSIEKAASTYTELATAYADTRTDLAEKAAFAAAHVYANAIYYDRAAAAYELVMAKFATSPRVADALFEAGLLRQALGQHDRAIAHYQTFAKRFPSHRNAPDVAFNIGVVLEDVGKDGPAHQAFADYARTFRSSGKHVLEATVRAGRTSFRLGQLVRAKEELAAARRLAKTTGGGKAWAAEARYYEGELVFRDFEAIVLEANTQLTARLAQKAKLLDAAEKIYGSVIDEGDAKWAVAALLRNGQIYDSFAENLADAANHPPKTLPSTQIPAYQDTLNDYAVKMQAKALTLYTGGYQMAQKLQLYDDSTAKLRKTLGRLLPKQFPPDLESRESVRSGDRPPVPPLVPIKRPIGP